MLDLAYVGCGVTASALAMDKVLAKRQLAAAGVPVVDFETASRREFETNPAAFLARCERLPLPLFVKPSNGGSSVGVRKVSDLANLEEAVRFALRFDEVALVERGIQGRELECAVLGYREIQASVVGEIVPGNEFYDYADKYLQDTAGLIAPAEAARAGVGPAARDRRRGVLRDRRRRLRPGRLPARGGRRGGALRQRDQHAARLHQHLDVPLLWSLTGYPLPKLVDRLVQIALERHRDRQRLDKGIKEFLAELALKA